MKALRGTSEVADLAYVVLGLSQNSSVFNICLIKKVTFNQASAKANKLFLASNGL